MGINVTPGALGAIQQANSAKPRRQKKALQRVLPEQCTLCPSATAVQASSEKILARQEGSGTVCLPQTHQQQHTTFQDISLLINTFLGTSKQKSLAEFTPLFEKKSLEHCNDLISRLQTP